MLYLFSNETWIGINSKLRDRISSVMQKYRRQVLLCFCFSQLIPTRYLSTWRSLNYDIPDEFPICQFPNRIHRISLRYSVASPTATPFHFDGPTLPLIEWAHMTRPQHGFHPRPHPRMTSYGVMPAHLYLLSPRRPCLLTSRRGARYGVLSRSLWVSPTKTPFLWGSLIVRAIGGNFANIYKFYEIRYRHTSHK